MSLYSCLLFFSIIVPLLLSFENKLQFYKKWIYILPAITIVAIVYIACDVYLTAIGVWGFNSLYHSNIMIFGLPIEEWLFFIVVPYASIFIHESIQLYFPKYKLSLRTTKFISLFFTILFIVIAVYFFDKIYSLYSSILMLLTLFINWLDKNKILSIYYITFLIILVPFLIVNSILTGTGIEQEVVWYNNNENLNIRLLTIPMEDFAYGFSMIYFSIWISEKLKTKLKK